MNHNLHSGTLPLATIQALIPALRRYARGLLRDRAEADDLVQDALERLVGRWHQHRADCSARAWAFRILHNLAIDRIRQQRRRGTKIAVEDLAEAGLSTRATQEDAITQKDVLALLSRLPDEQRSVLLFVAVEDLSYAETAAILDIPVGTVMSRLARGRERLRQLSMADDAGDDAKKLRIVR